MHDRWFLGFAFLVSLSLAPPSARALPSCGPALDVLRSHAAAGQRRWESGLVFGGTRLTNAPLHDLSRSTQILRAVIYEATVQAQVRREIEQFTGPLSPPPAMLWELYFGAYDRATAFSDGYLGIVQRAHEVLPAEGIIGDFGGGTGNFATALLALAPRRNLYLVDRSDLGLTLAREKLMVATDGDASRFLVEKVDLTDPTKLAQKPFAGAVINNVLYTIPAAAQVALLKEIRSRSLPGAPLIVSEALPKLAASRDELFAFLLAGLESTIRHRSPASEHDLVLLAYINVINMGPSAVLMPAEDLRARIAEAGWLPESDEASYFGFATLVVARNPK